MKKFLISVAALALTAGSAFAADLPSRKAETVLPPPPPPPMWTGFYAGLNVGGTWDSNNAINTGAGPFAIGPALNGLTVEGNTARANGAAAAAFSSVRSSGGGFIGGGQIGYNYQFLNNFVVGVETDIQGIAGGRSSGGAFTNAPVDTGPTLIAQYPTFTTAGRSISYIGTVRGRLGWLAMPNLLIYGTGGFAYGGVTLDSAVVQSALTAGGGNFFGILPPALGGSSYFSNRTGWTAGGGVEWMFAPNWSAKAEYAYYDLGNVSNNFTITQASVAAGVPVSYSFINAARTTNRFNGNIVRAGINYHFNWGAAPVVAKY